jgi:hypothetical protein
VFNTFYFNCLFWHVRYVLSALGRLHTHVHLYETFGIHPYVECLPLERLL